MFASPHLKPKQFAFSYVVTILPDAVSGMNHYGRTVVAQLNNIFIIWREILKSYLKEHAPSVIVLLPDF